MVQLKRTLNLGSWFDSNLSMTDHINKACNAAFYHLRNLRRIKKYLSRDSLITLVHAFITSRLDYCNGLLFGLPNVQIAKLQRVQKWQQMKLSDPRGVLFLVFFFVFCFCFLRGEGEGLGLGDWNTIYIEVRN